MRQTFCLGEQWEIVELRRGIRYCWIFDIFSLVMHPWDMNSSKVLRIALHPYVVRPLSTESSHDWKAAAQYWMNSSRSWSARQVSIRQACHRCIFIGQCVCTVTDYSGKAILTHLHVWGIAIGGADILQSRHLEGKIEGKADSQILDCSDWIARKLANLGVKMIFVAIYDDPSYSLRSRSFPADRAKFSALPLWKRLWLKLIRFVLYGLPTFRTCEKLPVSFALLSSSFSHDIRKFRMCFELHVEIIQSFSILGPCPVITSASERCRISIQSHFPHPNAPLSYSNLWIVETVSLSCNG
jgi:hypothetical protein